MLLIWSEIKQALKKWHDIATGNVSVDFLKYPEYICTGHADSEDWRESGDSAVMKAGPAYRPSRTDQGDPQASHLVAVMSELWTD